MTQMTQTNDQGRTQMAQTNDQGRRPVVSELAGSPKVGRKRVER
jgi:hypothetical protein